MNTSGDIVKGRRAWCAAVIMVAKSQTQQLNNNSKMKSRKMALMNLVAGKQWGHKYREWTCGHSGGRKE